MSDIDCLFDDGHLVNLLAVRLATKYTLAKILYTPVSCILIFCKFIEYHEKSGERQSNVHVIFFFFFSRIYLYIAAWPSLSFGGSGKPFRERSQKGTRRASVCGHIPRFSYVAPRTSVSQCWKRSSFRGVARLPAANPH